MGAVSVKRISGLEKSLRPKEKRLLHALKSEGWVLEKVEDGGDWAHESTWWLRSETKAKGFRLFLDFYRHNGEVDGMDRVVARRFEEAVQKSYYSGSPSIEFDTRRFEQQLVDFIREVDRLRCHPR